MKKSLILAILFLTLACQTVTGMPTNAPIAPPTAGQSNLPTNAPTATEQSVATPAPTPTTVTGFEQIRLLSKDGNFNAQLKDHAQLATVLGYLPVVEFDASW